jgi:hypothetical protein
MVLMVEKNMKKVAISFFLVYDLTGPFLFANLLTFIDLRRLKRRKRYSLS